MLTDWFTDNIDISVRNLKRQLAKLQLYGWSKADVVVNYIADQLQGPGHPVSMETPGMAEALLTVFIDYAHKCVY